MKRYHSAPLLLVFIFMLMGVQASAHVINKGSKVAYSLPDAEHFNISLKAEGYGMLPVPGKGGVKTVVLDAGHGGKDGGCSGKHSHEKDVALDITLRVGQLIKQRHPDVEVIYTRDRDEFIPLHERANIANKHQADLFISIHCNTTAKRNSAMGTETFVMGLHRAEDNLAVAKRENSVITHEENYEAYYGGYDPNSDEGHITLSMYQNAFLEQSIHLANLVENEFENHGQRVSRGVKQAGFLVLRNTVMPSILIEAGFLNHSKEEDFLVSEDGKKRIAESIFNAFAKYKHEQDQLVAYAEPKIEAIPADTDTKITASSSQIEEEEPVNYVERAKQEIARMKKERAQQQTTTTASAKTKPASEVPASTATSVAANQSAKPQPTKASSIKPVQGNGIVPKEKTLEYVVQISASARKFKSGGGKWDKVENVMIRYENNLYKYQVGELGSYQAAVAKKQELKSLGFTDCFIVAYYNDDQIDVKEAVRMGR